MFNKYFFNIYQKDNKKWGWRIQVGNQILGSSDVEFNNYQDVINEIVKIVKINRWEKEEPDLHKVMLELKTKDKNSNEK